MDLKNSKLIEILKSLNSAEMSQLESYVLSPYFNRSKQIGVLFSLIKENQPSYSLLTKEKIFKSIYSKESYQDKKVRDLLSRMLKLTEDFLAMTEYSQNKILQSRFTLQQLAARNLEKHFAGKIKETENEISKSKTMSPDLLFSIYSVFREKRQYMEVVKGTKKRAIYYGDISKEIDLFTSYTVYNILKYEIIILANEKDIKSSSSFKILDHVLEFVSLNSFDEYPVIMIYYYLIMLNRKSDDMEAYIKLRDLIDKNIDYVSEDDKVTMLVEQFNFTKIQALKGIDFYRKENYRILKQNTDKGIFPKEGKYFSENSFIMIASTAFQQKDFEWAESFIKKCLNEVDPAKKQNVYTYLMGALNYRKGNYGEALKYLAKVSTDDFTYYYRVKNNEIKIYYETGDYESVIRVADSYRHFLSKVKYMPDFIKERFTNFVNFLTRVSNAQLTGNLKIILDVKKEILSIKQETLENKIWLLDQINKIKI